MSDTPQGLRILLLEDDPNLGLIIQESLELRGFDVVLRPDGDQGLTAFTQAEFSLCLVDVMMPQIDGWEVLGQLKQHPLTSHIPIIVHTILAQEELALSLGASALLRKPVTRQGFLAALDQIAPMEPPTEIEPR